MRTPFCLSGSRFRFLSFFVFVSTAIQFHVFAAGCFSPPSGIVSWWPGDGTAADILTNNNGTLTGGATATNVGEVGQCFTFNGTTAYIQIPDAPAFHPTNFTVEFWVRFNSLNSTTSGAPAGQQYLFFKQNTRNGNFEGIYVGKERRTGGDVFVFGVSSAAGQAVEVDSGTNVTTNVWYHLAAVRGSNYIQLYTNGVSVGTAAVSFPQDYGTLPLFFGTSGASFWDGKLNGNLDEVSLYNRPLTATEVASIFAAGTSGKCKSGGSLSIITPLTNQTVVVGSPAQFTVFATGTPPLGYQWLFNSNVIPGANATNYVIASAQSSDAGGYSVLVTNVSGALTSSVAVLTVVTPPGITSQPQGVTNLVGATAVFSASASGTAPLSYQWQLNGGNIAANPRISGITSNVLTISNLQLTDAGSYSLIVTNAGGSTNTIPVTLAVNAPPGISGQPANQTVTVGANVGFSVAASGTAPLSYQWLRGGLPLSDGPAYSGTLTSSLTVSNVQLGDSGATFQVIVTNSFGTTNSQLAQLTVNPAPVAPGITSGPSNLVVNAGSNVTFTVLATGTTPLSYLWQKNNTNLPNGGNVSGATTAILSLASVQAADAAGYRVIVTNTAGAITSLVASLTVDIPPSITSQPASQSVFAGSNTTFTVGASGTAPLFYQWRFNATNLTDGPQFSGTASATLSINNAQPTNAGGYSVVITNIAGATNSITASLTVNVPGSCVSSPSGILSWWPGDGNAQDIIGTNNGTLMGGATATATGEDGQAFSFDGTNNFVQIPDSPSIDLQVFTVEAWIKFKSLDSQSSGGSPAGQQYIIFKQNTRNGDFEGMAITKSRRTGGDAFAFSVTSASGVGADVLSTPNIAINTWYHLAAVRGSNFIQLYINGQSVGQSNITFAQNYGTFPFFFGTSGQSFWDHKFSGWLDEVSLYNRALTATEIAAIYNAGSAGKCKGPSGPAILAQPQSQTLIAAANASFTVTSSGTAPLSYQWLRNGTNLIDGPGISGSLTSSLTISNVQVADSGEQYQVTVSNVVSTATSQSALLTVNPAPVPPGISIPPASLSVLPGSNVSFTVTASGTTPLSYQWLKNNAILNNGGNVSGATTPALGLASVQAADAAGYSVIVTNIAGSITSTVATLTVDLPPGISTQPSNQIVLTGTPVSFTVVATGTAPLTYGWQYKGTPIFDGLQFNGTATPTLSIFNPQPTNSGGYSVVIANSYGAITSSVATLTVNQPGSCDPSPTGIVSWWPAEGSAADLVGPNNGTLMGGAGASAGGEVGLAFSFDGTNNFVQIPDSPSVDLSNLTIEAWIKFKSLDSQALGGSPAGQQYIIFKQNTRTSDFEGYALTKTRRNGGDAFAFSVTSATDQAADVYGPSTIATNTWYHVAGVRGSNFIALYINGQFVGQSNITFAQSYGTFPLYFGTSGQSFWDHKFSGWLDEAALYNRGLSAAEIAAIYNAGTAGKCKAPVAPTIASQPQNQLLAVGGTAIFSVVAAGTQPLGYQWYKDGFKTFDGPNISGSLTPNLTLLNLQLTNAGNYDVVVSNSIGAVTSLVATLSTGTPPTNDNFSAAQAISGTSGSITGNNFSATKEPGEPNHAGDPGGASVWYNWTASSTSPVTFDTALSGFDTLLAVYTGNSVSNLTLVASNDNMNKNSTRSRLTFTPVSGTVYHVAVDGKGGANGSIVLRWVQASVALPDLSIVASAINPAISTETFSPSSCAVLEGLIQAGTRTIIRFNTQTENSGTADLFFGNPASNPLFVWAPCHAHYHFQNYMSYRLRDTNGNIAAIGLKVGFCILDVFRWNPNSASTALYNCNNQGIQTGWGDLYDSTLDGQWIDITGLPNGNYTIEIEANPAGIIQESNYSNNISSVPISIGNPNAPPLNDNFASSQVLLGGFSSVPGSNLNATKQAGEPNHAGNAGGHSVWYQWTALSTKPVTIDTIGSSFNTLLAVYTGNSLNNLSLVASNDDIAPGNLQSRLTFNATAGVVYQIAVDGYNGATGNLVLTLNQTIGNDNFANCQFVGGVSGLVYGSNSGATKEAGEPNHANDPGGASIWYCWTAPINGVVTFNTLGSTFNTLLAAYTGGSVSNLALMAANAGNIPTNGLLESSISFNAVGLTMYHIAIDGAGGATGDTTMNWNLVSGGSSPQSVSPLALHPRTGVVTDTPGLNVTMKFIAEGACQLDIAGKPQQLYRVETSCDLMHWRPLVSTMSDNTGHAYFTDKATMHMENQSTPGEQFCGPGKIVGVASSSTSRFYRAVPTTQ